MATIKQIKDTEGNVHDILSTIGYGTCATAAATAAKVATISDTSWTLKVGSIIGIKYTYSNTAGSTTTPVTLNVNDTGAKNIWYNNAKYTSTSTSICGYAKRVIYYMYDGTYWAWLGTGYMDGNTDKKTSSSNKEDTKLFLVGAETQSTSGQTTYSNSNCYIGTDNCLYSNNQRVDVEGHSHDNLLNLIEVSYDNLVSLRNESQLIPGQQYRITDYITKVSSEAADVYGHQIYSAEHQFDIIVTALDDHKLSEEARAIRSVNNAGYCDECNLSAWKIWYCLDNDTNRFDWVDNNCKGVIYRMIDEWGNDCPYDFKNIMFHRFINESHDITCASDNNIYDWGEEYIEMYCYTFSWFSGGEVYDASILGNNGSIGDENGNIVGVYKNIIRNYSDRTRQYLNNIVLFNYEHYNSGWFCGIYLNVFGDNCYDITLNSDCSNNTFGNNCHSNVLGGGCCSNTFGNNCYGNILNYNCSNNTFGNECYANIIGINFINNTCGDLFYSNEFIIENFYNNTFGNNVHDNSFEHCISNCTFLSNIHGIDTLYDVENMSYVQNGDSIDDISDFFHFPGFGLTSGQNEYGQYTLNLKSASSTELGGVKKGSTVTSATGYTPCPIINDIVYYKDTDTDSDKKTTSEKKQNTQLYLVGAQTMSNYGQTTYSNEKCYVGTDNCLYSNGKKVSTDDHSHSYPTFSGNNTFTGTNTFNKIILDSASNSYIEYTNEKLFINSDEIVKITSDLEVTGIIDGTVTTATNLTNAPVLSVGSEKGDTICVSVGGKTSNLLTVPYATRAGSATNDSNGRKISDTYALGSDLESFASYANQTFALREDFDGFTSYASQAYALREDFEDFTEKGSLKNPNSIKFKNTSGTVVEYDGSSGKDLSGGVYYATSAGSAKNPNAIKFKNALGTVITYDGSSAADLSGGVYNATTATNASNVNVNINNNTGNLPILFTTRTSGTSATESASNRKVYIDSTKDTFYYNPSTNQVTAAGGFFETSDGRLKDIVNPITVDLDKLSKLRKVYFNWKDKPDSNLQLGMIAQDVQELYPEIVSEADGQLSLSYEKLSVIALEAIDVLHNENKELKNRIEKLESMFNRFVENKD